MRERVHYGSLDVEDLGRVYEALLELEPGIGSEPMCRLRRQKLEVVVPVAQGEKYRPARLVLDEADFDVEEDSDTEDEAEDAPTKGKKTKVQWIEEIPPGRFYLRVGLGRKATGSYYTPHSFVRFLVQETLGTQVEERSPKDNPRPGAILQIKVLDPAMGSGHFLVEACRFLGDKLYEACRLCDERATAAEKRAETAKTEVEREAARQEAQEFRQRVIDLPDPDDKLVKYLPSSAPEGQESGFSQKEAEALCRRLVAVHCLYGVDKNPLAVELAKLSLWLESHAEGLPLTFLDHRLVVGDSLTGPFFEHLLKYPGSQDEIDPIYMRGIRDRFTQAMAETLKHVRDLEATVGADISEIEAKQAAKARLDRAIAPFKIVAAAWTGGVMLGGEDCDDVAYSWLIDLVGQTGDLPEDLSVMPKLRSMVARGLGVEEVPATRDELLAVLSSSECILGLSYDLTFAEVFYPDGTLDYRCGFDAVLGNPPWEGIDPAAKEFFASYDLSVLDANTQAQRQSLQNRLLKSKAIANAWSSYLNKIYDYKKMQSCIYSYIAQKEPGIPSGATPDTYQYFVERSVKLLKVSGNFGILLPGGLYLADSSGGIRSLLFQEFQVKSIFGFRNIRKLFAEIGSTEKYAPVIACKSPFGTENFESVHYIEDDNWLFQNTKNPTPLKYSYHF